MTENLAARGEGLAGLRKIAELARQRGFDAERYGKAITATNFHEIARQLEALEAAAPAGTARPLRFAHDNESLEDFVRCLAQATIYRSHDTGDVIGEYWREEAIEWVKEFGAAALATPSPQAPQVRKAALSEIPGWMLNDGITEMEVPAATQEQPAGSGMHAENCNSVLFNGPMGKCDCRETCQHCGEDLTLHHARNLRCRGKETIYRRSKLPQSFDARDWAKEFTEICATKGIVIEQDWMETWFANAIMAGYDHARAGSPRKVGEAQVTLETVFDEEHQDGEWRNAVAEQLNTLLTRAKYCADTTNDESDKDVERATLAIVERVATFEHIRVRSSSVPVGEQPRTCFYGNNVTCPYGGEK